MRHLRTVFVILAALLLVAHGLAHAPGALGSLELATFDDVSYQPNVLFTDAGDTLMRMLGVAWAVAGVAFIVAGIGVALQRLWVRPATIVALAVSLPLTLLWYQDAVAGLVLNVVVLVAIVVDLARRPDSGKRMTPAMRKLHG